MMGVPIHCSGHAEPRRQPCHRRGRRPWHRELAPRCAAAVLAAGVYAAANAETLAQFLDSGALEDVTNPVPISYFLEQAPAGLSGDLHQTATEQAEAALRHQTSAMNKLGESIAGAMSGPTSQKVAQRSEQQMTMTNVAKQMVLGQFGIQSQQQQPTQSEVAQMQQEMRRGMTDPWIRGIESARALERSGNAQAAGRFYINCIQAAPPDFLADACLNGILAMGIPRAQALLAWAADHAEEAALGGIATSGNAGEAAQGVVWLRGAALRGLGALIGSGALSADQATADFAVLLNYAHGQEHAPYFGDAAEGLGRSHDPRAAGSLRELAKSKDGATAQAALKALAVGLHDPAATDQLRRLLDDKDPATQQRAADALLDAGDEQGYAWVRHQIGSQHDPESGTDLRPGLVRDLVARGDERAREALETVLRQGAGNDFLQAWIEVGLLEMGDRSQLEPALAALRRHDWSLDRPGIKAQWRRISPLVNLAVSAAVAPVSVTQVAKVIVNFGIAEAARATERAADRDLASLQLRWQACSALAVIDDPRASAQLVLLLADPEPAVRLNAASALAVQPGSGALDGLAKAFHADFGSADGESRTPEVRAAVLRAALTRAARDPRTIALAREAAQDADPGLRFMGLLATLQ